MAQTTQMLETIRAMKLAMKRRAADDDGGESPVRKQTNRGHKLQRNARFVQHHRLDSTGALAFRKKVEHAGYTRTTISTNPPLFDDYGDPYSPASSDNEGGGHAEPLEDDPFEGIHLQELLRPLVSAADLPTHPTLSLPFTSKALTQMADEALEMLHRERASLWKAKRLLQRFRGDGDWMPCETFEAEDVELLLTDEGGVVDQSAESGLDGNQLPLQLDTLTRQQGEGFMEEPTGDDNFAKAVSGAAEGNGMEGVEALDMAVTQTSPTTRGEDDGAKHTAKGEAVGPAGDDTASKREEPTGQTLTSTSTDIAEREAISETASNSNGTNTHAMTTRARARSPAERSDRTPSPSPSDSASILAIHPWFVPPTSSRSDRDLGLPASEAEETRKLLLLYVQKQEQIVRSLDALYTGLHKADRLRRYVFRSCKAEGHLMPDGKGNMVTEMSDGEDWYDISEWNIQPWELKDGNLEKGKDEVEDAEEEGRRRPGRGRRVNRM